MKNLIKRVLPHSLLLIFLIAFAGGWMIYNRKKIVVEETSKISSFVPVETKIESVFPSGRGFRRTTIITVSYSYEGKQYRNTVRMGGYVEGIYEKGNNLTLYLNPANPDEITPKKSEKKPALNGRFGASGERQCSVEMKQNN